MQRGVEEAEATAKRKNNNFKLGIKSPFSKAKETKKKLDVEKISEMAQKLNIELSDQDISNFTSDENA